MHWRRWVLFGLLLAVLATTGCGFRRSSYRRPCDPAPAYLPVTPVPVVAGSAPCCCP